MEVGLCRRQLGLGLAHLRFADHQPGGGLFSRVKGFPLLPCHHRLGLLLLQHHLGAGHRGHGSFDGELVIARLDLHEWPVGRKEPARHKGWIDLHHPTGHLRNDVHRHLGTNLAVTLDHHRNIRATDLEDLDQRPQGYPLGAQRSLASPCQHHGHSHTHHQHHKRKNDLELAR